jgi:hypothetical protein
MNFILRYAVFSVLTWPVVNDFALKFGSVAESDVANFTVGSEICCSLGVFVVHMMSQIVVLVADEKVVMTTDSAFAVGIDTQEVMSISLCSERDFYMRLSLYAEFKNSG